MRVSAFTATAGLTALLAFVFPIAAKTAEDSPIIDRVEFSGLVSVDRAEVEAAFGIRPGDRYDADRVREGFRALWKLGIFRDVGVEVREAGKGRTALEVRTQERPAVVEVTYERNEVILEQIGKHLENVSAALVIGAPLSPSAVAGVRHRIKNLLIRKGYPEASVRSIVEQRSPTTCRVHFTITPGRPFGSILESLEQAHGPESWRVHFELRRMARAYTQAGMLAEARPLYARIFDREVAVQEASTGQDLRLTPLWTVADELTALLRKLGDDDARRKVRQRLLALESASGNNRFVLDDGALAISRPDESWKFEIDDTEPNVVARISSPDGLAVTDIQRTQVPGATLAQVKEPIEQAIAAQAQDFTKLSGRDVDVRGIAAYELTVTATEEGTPQKAKMLIFKPGDTLYVVKCKVSADEWERFEPECGTILASFELIEEQGRRFVPTDRYQKKFIEGWTIYVNEDLLADGTELGNQVLRLLKAKLYEAERVLPAKACEELRGVPIWLEVDDGGASGAGYVSSSREALRANGYNPDKAKSIQIRNASRFLRWTLDQPALLLHELAHAYHDRVLGQDHESIAAAFRAAVQEGRYETVLQFDGREDRAYALENDSEYFAEGTEAFFGTNDAYPFVRAELLRHDPKLFEVLQEVWGVGDVEE
jgi:hypothetical protein